MTSTPYDLIAEQFGEGRTDLLPKEVEYLALLLEPLAPGSTILDLGCGTGHPIATFLILNGHRIVGVDGSSAMLAEARKRHPDQRWIHAFMDVVDFDETFDAVVCWDSLFHVPRQGWRPMIEKVHRWLRPHGRLMLSSGGLVPSDGEGFTDTMFGHEFYYDSLPPDTLVDTLTRTGFDIVLTEMCDQPDGGRNKGKWATIASRPD
jgi:cyclopropane fatty-acyl-phospholipid synthase-like methyltransferase